MPASPFPGIETHHRGGEYAVLDSGAQVLAWTPPGHNPVLWVSPLATFEPGVVVRGGVPVVFPWFGGGPSGDRTPAHGFARTAPWRRVLVANDVAASGRLEVRHELASADLDGSDAAPGPFVARLVSVFTPSQVSVSLEVENLGATTLRYEEALHTYLAVGDVTAVGVGGLDGCPYFDKVTGGEEVRQSGDVRFEGETDRIYRHPGGVRLTDASWGRSLEIAKEGSANTVVWNPGKEKGAALADVGRYWNRFVCVEAGNVRDEAIELAPGEEHILTQTVRVS